ncbi:Tc toxin subunit A [Pseudomonas capsici]|uniref:Tc toxin subunit A n=1 Tax=Pseudomonas capsici TaxID=2810614 RepID=UPI0021F18651|nr:Tc toxin subunit A [Pseudomonas capsici]MCV4264266.1 Tc toxin subunit A [Pseudomonas capsici]
MTKEAGKTGQADSALAILLKRFDYPQTPQAALSDQFPSVFSIATATPAQLLESDPLLHISTARSLHAASISMSAAVARQFRERRLTASVRQALRNGITGLVDTPTYTDMFNPDWASHCPPDAIEATTSPIAYLADLYREVEAIEKIRDPERAITLSARRPDLATLLLDHNALNCIEPTLVLANEVLEKSIRSYLDGISLQDKSVDDVMLETRYPFVLPYERYQQQINYVLSRRQRLPGDPIRAADPAYPYFKEPGVHSLLSDIALIQDSGLGPVQQGLLVEAPHLVRTESGETISGYRINPRNGRLDNEAMEVVDFFKDNFGTDDIISLTDTQTFCLRTGLSTDQLDSLLSVGPYAPLLSANVKDPGTPVDGSAYGSVYINAGQSPAIAIKSSQEGGAPVHRLINCLVGRFDQMNRMIRLANWLQLPFDEVDQLLAASQQAEQRATDVVRRRSAPATYLITQNTLRSLGLFQVLRTRYDVPAEDFAALLYGVAVYGRGKTPSQFDRIFNSQALFSIPLVLDGSPFTVVPKSEAERQKIDHLCAALGLTYEMYRFVAKVVEQSWAGESLQWTREVVSAFYRLVRLPRYLGLSTIETLALLELLDSGGSQLTSKLAGMTQIATYYASANTDTLSVIHALVDCATWLQENQWTVAQLCRLALPALTLPVATDAEHNLLQQIHARLTSALITDSSFAQVGAPDSSENLQTDANGREVYFSEPIDWFAELSGFVDAGTVNPAAKGLVKYLKGESEEVFEQALSSDVKRVLESLGLPVEELHPKITNMVMRARGAQEALLMEGLAAYLSTSADQAKALLFWSEGNRYQLLLEVLRVYGFSTAAEVAIGDEVLLVLDALSKRAVLSRHLTLSPALITQYVEHPEWFGLPDTDLSLQSVYFLTQYANALRLSEQNEDTLLDYFRLINTLWEDATEGDKRLIRDSAASKLAGFLRWGVRDVLAIAHLLNPEAGVIFTLREFDVLVREALLSRHTGLDANALLALHALTPTTSTELYRRAAELALSSLTEAVPAGATGEVGQSHSSVITVTPDYLVAQRENEFANYTITLRDFMDEPLNDVTVNWTTDLGSIDQVSSITDEHGQASNTLRSGNVMGIAHVVAHYGLGEQLMAPVVVIDCDEDSLHFVEGQYEPSTALANNIEGIYFSVTMVDEYENKGIDRAVEWGATLGEFKRFQTYTNQQGIAEAELRSRPAGESIVIAHYKNGREWEFIPVEFVSIPYFQYVRFSNTIIVGIETKVKCSLVELDGTPVVGADVAWSDDVGGVLDATSKTDTNGIAVARFKTDQEGTVIVTVSVGTPTKDKNSEETIIYPAIVIDKYEASDTEFLVGSAQPIIFSIWLKAGGEAVRRVPVEWLIDNVSITTTYTDSGGKSTFSSRFDTGKHIVKAKVGGTGETVEFPVSALPPCEFEVTIDGFHDPENPVLLAKAHPHSLLVKVVDQSGNVLEGVEFKMSHVYQPFYYAIEGLEETMVSSLEGSRFSVVCQNHPAYGDIEITLSGRLPKTLVKTYKIGWIWFMSGIRVFTYDYKANIYFKHVSGDSVLERNEINNTLPDIEVMIDFSVEGKDWKTTLPVGTITGMPMAFIPSPNAQDVLKDDWFLSGPAIVLDGCISVLPSRVAVEVFSKI